MMTDDKPQSVKLRIYRAASGQWWGRLIVGEEEIGRVGYCGSPQAVEQAACISLCCGAT
jgi:hypothetical protein